MSADDAQNVAFLHDEEILAVDLHFRARPFAEQDLVAGLDVERRDRAVLAAGAGADRDDLALLGLFLGGVGDDDASGRLLLGLDAADEHAIVERSKLHTFTFLNWGMNCCWHSRGASANADPFRV